jgi:ABC-type branched-subunit amino acid transport system substrate-binding protein
MLERLAFDDEVFAIVGHFGTPVIAGTYEMLLDMGIPTVYFAAGIGVVYQEDARETGGLNTFPVQPVFPMEGRIFAAWAAGEFGGTTIGVIHTSDDAGQDMINGIRQEAEVIGGLEIVAESVEPGAEDVTAQVMSVLAENPDVVIIASIQGTVLQIARELAAQGSTVPAITSYVNADQTISDQLAGDIAGHYELYASSWVAMIDEDMEDYRYWVAQVQNEDLSSNSFAMTGWIAAHFFAEGLRRTPDDAINWSNFIAAMEEAPIQNPFGSAIDFSEGSRVGTQQLALLRMDGSEAIGWASYLDFMSMEEILAD